MLHAWILITHACICDYYIFFSKCWEVLAQWHSRFVLTSVIDQKCLWSVWHSTSMQRPSEPQSLLVLKGSLSKQCWWPSVSVQRMMEFFAVALRPQYSFSQHSLTIPIKGPASLLEFCQVARCQLQLLSGTGKPAASPQCQENPVPPKQDQRKPNSFKQNNPNLFSTLFANI